MKKVTSVALTLILFAATAPPLQANADEQTEPDGTIANLLISEIQTGSTESANEEFVEIYNPDSESVDLTDWQLQYKSSSGTTWTNKIATDQPADTTFLIGPGEHFVLGTDDFMDVEDQIEGARINGGLAKGGGHLCLAAPNNIEPNPCDDDTNTLVADTVGWGSADNPLGEAAAAPEDDESISRCFDSDVITNTQNNADDFVVLEQPTPSESAECPSQDDPDDPPQETTCDGAITEILPNAAGSDDGNEFIELYNPTTDLLQLEGCGLAVNSSDIYWFEEDIELEPEEYMAFYDDQTGLTLPNAAGGTVYLLSSEEDELHEVTYEPDLDDDVSWIWVEDEKWEQSYTPTPNALNVRQPLKPCPEGQVRNPDTNRCNSISTEENELKPCEPNEERNPETNRCRDIDSGNTLKPCGPDQERNPKTNRCRKIGGTSDLKPCDPDQERNPETNRCRKVASSSESSTSNVHDIQAVNEGNPYRWWIAGGAIAAVVVYGVFEWRRDIANLLFKLKR